MSGERYVVSRPLALGGCPGVEGCDATRRTFLSDAQVPGCGHYLDMTWIHADSQPGRYASTRLLDHDQYLLHLGMDWAKPQDLGATVEFHLGGQPITFSTMTSIYIPAGIPYGPLSWKEFSRPHIQLCLVFGCGEAPVGRTFRVGGLVEKGSLRRDPDGLGVHFVVTDTAKSIAVSYRGVLPDLFKEGKGVVAQGKLGPDGVFTAQEVLAKHDENYMPPEAAAALKQAADHGGSMKTEMNR